MARWECLRTLPSQMKDALTDSWLEPAPTVKGLLTDWLSRLWCRPASPLNKGGSRGIASPLTKGELRGVDSLRASVPNAFCLMPNALGLLPNASMPIASMPFASVLCGF